MEITVLYPAYNEEANIRDTIERSLAALRPLFKEFEILIIDDGSKDATATLADELAGRHPEVRVLRHEKNQGAGQAIVTGIDHARGALVIHNGMDYPFDLAELSRMLPLLDRADVVVAVRENRESYNWYRKLLSRVNLTLLNVLFGLWLRDYNFVQLYKREVLVEARPEGRTTGFLTPEMLIRANAAGYRIAQVVVPYLPRTRGVATSGNLRVVASSMRDLLAFRLRWTFRKRRKVSQPTPDMAAQSR
jgi:glycosyltransferase involved in cell wall biosynthesis